MQKLCLVAVIAALGVTTTLPAQRRGGSDPKKTWSYLKDQHDKNGDGKIQKEEYTRGEAKFTRYDKDKDGVLTDADFVRDTESGRGRGRGGRNSDRMIQMMGGRIALAADSDKSGAVTTAEWKAFTKSVSSGDDGIDVEALAAKMPQQTGGGDRSEGGRGQGDGGQGGRGQGERTRGGRRGGGMRINARMLDRMFDFDKSGEFGATDMSALFAKLDKDSDGTLSKQELTSRRRGGGQGGSVPKVGEVAPDFELPYQSNTQKKMKLSSFAGQKPVALIFGSYT